MENIITFPAKIGSNNYKAYGIVNADQVSGHKTVVSLNDLFNLPASILSKSGTNENNDAIGQEWWVQEKNAKYRLTSWVNRNTAAGWAQPEVQYVDGTNIVVSDSAPSDTNDIWADDDEKSIPQYVNEDLQSIISAIKALQEAVKRYEYAFNNQLSSGNFKNNAADMIMSVEAEAPEGMDSEIGETPVTEYPDYASDVIPNIKHICIKAGTYTSLLENADKFLNNELLWCTDVRRLYIKSEGSLVWLNKPTSDGGDDDDPDVPSVGGMTLEDLDKLETIGFVSPSGQTYRVKVNDEGELVVYMKELDTPQPEPTGAQTDNNGWVYVKSLYLQKLYINSLYCGGLTSDEHSYNYCSHNFVELSNLTNADVNLNGLSLQYSANGTDWKVLPLSGVIKKGSTFLIRGAQCSVMDANTTRIKVKSYDMQWYDGNELIKFDNTKAKFYLTWGKTSATVANPYSNVQDEIKISKGYIDLVGLNKENADAIDKIDASEKNPYAYLNTSRLFTKYYSMDPTTQATKALDKRNNANDWYFVDLAKDIVPMIEDYTPKASFENKNIFYNKTSLDVTKPNYITCTFGIQATAPNATRCFNWLSVEYYDEFIWYRKRGEQQWIQVESFKNETGIRSYYNRLRSEFTDGTPFVSHKVIIKNLSAGVYEYKVGRDDQYVSDIKTFTVVENPSSFTFVQTSDQQGFRWDEYQIWKGAAKVIADNHDFNFIINTGDITQNGNRLNEWLDYEHARELSFSGIEEMTVIGNNDLCPEKLYQLGDGGDVAKINPRNMSYFYTYEMDENNPPIFNLEGKQIFVDSLYSFNYGNTHFLCVNSEITDKTETIVYGLSTNGLVYDEMKKWCEKDLELNSTQTWRIAVMHELPFTILTQYNVNQFYWQGVESNTPSRSGSHINYNNLKKNEYWFSTFCQEHDIRLAIGGHKHTYAATLPLLENPENNMKPIIQVTQKMLQELFGATSLELDAETGNYFPNNWIGDATKDTERHLCKFQLVDKITAPIYITNQATGYKHTSNKELPSARVPWDYYYFPCTSTIVDQKTVTDKVNSGQLYPFYTVYEINNDTISCTTKKIKNLFDSKGKYNVNYPNSAAPESIPGNGQQFDGEHIIVIEK